MVYNGNFIKIDDLGVPLFLETPLCKYSYLYVTYLLEKDLVLEGLSPNIEDVFRFVGIHTYFPVKTKMESENNPF